MGLAIPNTPQMSLDTAGTIILKNKKSGFRCFLMNFTTFGIFTTFGEQIFQNMGGCRQRWTGTVEKTSNIVKSFSGVLWDHLEPIWSKYGVLSAPRVKSAQHLLEKSPVVNIFCWPHHMYVQRTLFTKSQLSTR